MSSSRRRLGRVERLTTFNSAHFTHFSFSFRDYFSPASGMFPVSVTAFLCVALCAGAAPAANTNITRGPKTFIYFDKSVTDEPIDYVDEDGRLNHSSGGQAPNRTIPRRGLSDHALMFLTGPVSTILLPSFYTLVCSISVPINVCALLAFARGIRPKKPAAIYMLNLAFADLLFALMLPFKISYHFEGNNWKFGSVMCRVVTAAFYWNMYCSVLLIACISVDRLLAVVYPIDSLAWRRPRNTIRACVTMWVLSFAGSVPLVTSNQTFHLSELNITTCHDVQSQQNIIWLKIYFLILCCVLFFLPLLITVVSYTRVIWSLSSIQHRLPGSSRKRTRATVMVLTVLVIFVLCFMPTNCFLLAHYLQFNEGLEKSRDTPDGSYALYLVFLCLGSLNCLLDPLLYYFGSSQCQKQVSNMLKCHKATKNNYITHSSLDSCRSSTRPMLKSSCTQSSKISSSFKVDS